MGLRQLMSGSLGRHKTKKNKKATPSTLTSTPLPASPVKDVNKMNNRGKYHNVKPMTTYYGDGTTAPRDRVTSNQMSASRNDYAYIKPLPAELHGSESKTSAVKSHFIVNFTPSDDKKSTPR